MDELSTTKPPTTKVRKSPKRKTKKRARGFEVVTLAQLDTFYKYLYSKYIFHITLVYDGLRAHNVLTVDNYLTYVHNCIIIKGVWDRGRNLYGLRFSRSGNILGTVLSMIGDLTSTSIKTLVMKTPRVFT